MTAAVLAVPAGAVAGTVTLTSGSIAIPTGSVGGTAASPYPSTLTVPGAGTVQNVRVTLNSFTLERPDSVDIALQGPNGQTVMILSDAGDTQPVSALTLSFDQTGTDVGSTACSPPAVTAVLPGPGTYKPIDCVSNNPDFPSCNEADLDIFPGGPVGPFGTNLSTAFNTASQTGDWKLWVFKDCPTLFAGLINSWTLTITNANPTAVKLTSVAAARTGRGIVVRWRTANESDVLGYNVWRMASGRTAKLNRTLVAAKASGRVAAGAYRLVDRSARTDRAYTYRLQVVNLDGSRYWLGTSTVSALL